MKLLYILVICLLFLISRDGGKRDFSHFEKNDDLPQKQTEDCDSIVITVLFPITSF